MTSTQPSRGRQLLSVLAQFKESYTAASSAVKDSQRIGVNDYMRRHHPTPYTPYTPYRLE